MNFDHLPKGWKWINSEDFVDHFQNGFAFSKRFELPNSEDVIPHLRPNNIGFDGKLDKSKLVYISREMANLHKYAIKKGDVLFNNTNSKELIGRAVLVKENLHFAFSNHITKLSVRKGIITPDWLTMKKSTLKMILKRSGLRLILVSHFASKNICQGLRIEYPDACYHVDKGDLLRSKRVTFNEPRNVSIYLTKRLRGDGLGEICTHEEV